MNSQWSHLAFLSFFSFFFPIQPYLPRAIFPNLALAWSVDSTRRSSLARGGGARGRRSSSLARDGEARAGLAGGAELLARGGSTQTQPVDGRPPRSWEVQQGKAMGPHEVAAQRMSATAHGPAASPEQNWRGTPAAAAGGSHAATLASARSCSPA